HLVADQYREHPPSHVEDGKFVGLLVMKVPEVAVRVDVRAGRMGAVVPALHSAVGADNRGDDVKAVAARFSLLGGAGHDRDLVLLGRRRQWSDRIESAPLAVRPWKVLGEQQ